MQAAVVLQPCGRRDLPHLSAREPSTQSAHADGNRTTGLDLHHSGSGAQPSSENMVRRPTHMYTAPLVPLSWRLPRAAHGQIPLKTIQEATRRFRALQSPSTDFTKRQVVKMLRMLITINTTLLPLPEERCVLMKVEYTPDAPRTFATPNFRDATPAEATAAFATTPFTTCAPP